MRVIKQTAKKTKATACQQKRSLSAGQFFTISFGKVANTKLIRAIMPAVFKLKRSPNNKAIGTSPYSPLSCPL